MQFQVIKGCRELKISKGNILTVLRNRPYDNGSSALDIQWTNAGITQQTTCYVWSMITSGHSKEFDLHFDKKHKIIVSQIPDPSQLLPECNVFSEIQKVANTIKGENLEKFIKEAVEGHTRQIARELYLSVTNKNFTPDIMKLVE